MTDTPILSVVISFKEYFQSKYSYWNTNDCVSIYFRKIIRVDAVLYICHMLKYFCKPPLEAVAK